MAEKTVNISYSIENNKQEGESPSPTQSLKDSTVFLMAFVLFTFILFIIFLMISLKASGRKRGGGRPKPEPAPPLPPDGKPFSFPIRIFAPLTPRLGTPVSGSMGNYVLLEKLGEGGYSKVYRAKHRFLDYEAALKVMGYLEAFEKELKSLKELNHPHILKILDAGVEGDKHYLALELGDGDLLGVRLPLPDEEVAKLGYALASALDYAHSRGVVHGDVKPSNVILVRSSEGYIPKLADFSIAKIIAEESGTLTMSTTLKGTLAFIDPHLVRKFNEGTQTFEDYIKADIYSLGMTLSYVIGSNSRLRPLIGRMTSAFPDERPSLKEVMEELKRMMTG